MSDVFGGRFAWGNWPALRLALAAAEGEGRAMATCAVELPEGEPPEWIDLLPAGAISARDGRAWTADTEAVLAATRERAGTTRLVVDYEHQTDHAPTNGQPAPAAGWITELARGQDGMIRARIEWTEAAAAALKAREYRYISPAFLHDAQGRVQAIVRAGLTNNPALDLPALAAMNVPIRDLLTRFDLEEGADAEAFGEAVARFDAMLEASKALQSIAKLVKLDPLLPPKDIRAAVAEALEAGDAMAAAMGVAPTAAQGERRAAASAISEELATLRAEHVALADGRIAALVDGAIRDGKVPPAQRDQALALARANPDGYRDYIAAAPQVIAPGAIVRAVVDGIGEHGLTAEELAMCRTLRVTPEAFAKAKEE